MIFITILILSALIISGVAGYFSIYGLASMFTGAFWPVVVMGSSLEIGKLVSASYVYRYWKKINFLLKSYLISAILILMLITSMGIFGFLSAAYQEDSMPLKEMEQTIVLLKSEKEEILFRKRQIDADIASLPSNYISGRERLMKQYGPEVNKINLRLDNIASETLTLSKTKLNQEAHTGPIIYIAKVFDKEVDDAIKYMILLLVVVFDPLAVILVISANIALRDHKEAKHVKEIVEVDEIIEYPQNEGSSMDEESHSAIRRVVTKKQIIDQVRSNQ